MADKVIKEAEDVLKARYRKLKASKLITAIISIVFGVLLLVFADTAIRVIVTVFGVVLLITGVVAAISFIVSRDKGFSSGMALVGGAFLIIIGILILTHPDQIAELFPIMIGIVLAVNGIADIVEGFRMMGKHYVLWYTSVITGVIMLLLSALLIFKPFGIVEFIVQVVGVVMILNGISDLYVLYNIHGTEKVVRQAVKDAAAVETSGTVIDAHPAGTAQDGSQEGPSAQA